MTRVCISTGLGDLLAEIYEERAPRTASHFLRYVDDGHYNGRGAGFYRAVRSGDQHNQPLDEWKIDVIEGGFCNGYYAGALKACFDTPEPYDACKGPAAPRMTAVETTGETGLRHLDGVLSMGRTGMDAVDDSIFICVGGNPHLDMGGRRHPDGLGFSAFGRITGGMEIVRRIHASPAQGQLLVDRVEIRHIKRVCVQPSVGAE